jgi:hypothetical protein
LRLVNSRGPDIVGDHGQNAAGKLRLFHFRSAGVNAREVQVDGCTDQGNEHHRERDSKD